MSDPTCKECGCQIGGGAFCYQHAPYMVYPKADGTFLSDRNGRHRVWLVHPPSLESEADVIAGPDLRPSALPSPPLRQEPQELKLQRFRLHVVEYHPYDENAPMSVSADMVPDADGEWVRYSEWLAAAGSPLYGNRGVDGDTHTTAGRLGERLPQPIGGAGEHVGSNAAETTAGSEPADSLSQVAAVGSPPSPPVDLRRVVDAARQHYQNDSAWRAVSGPAYFESNIRRGELTLAT